MKRTHNARKGRSQTSRPSVDAKTPASTKSPVRVAPGDLSPARQQEQNAEHAANHRRNSKLFMRMESEVYDLSHQASATRLLLDDYLDEIEGMERFPKATVGKLIQRTQTQAYVIDYMVTQLNRMAQALREFYTDGDAKAAA